MNQLPKELQYLIYSFDNTYRLQFDEVLKSISKKSVSIFKHKNKYTYCSTCDIQVQNYNRHLFSINHEYNQVAEGYCKYYATIALKIIRYINSNNIHVRSNELIHLLFERIELDDYERYALDNYYTNFNVIVKIVKHELLH
jgi:hypothetical protein